MRTLGEAACQYGRLGGGPNVTRSDVVRGRTSGLFPFVQVEALQNLTAHTELLVDYHFMLFETNSNCGCKECFDSKYSDLFKMKKDEAKVRRKFKRIKKTDGGNQLLFSRLNKE
jgi:hypothetical protein